MTLQEEINQLREVLQATVDYVGNEQVHRQLQENREKKQVATATVAAMDQATPPEGTAP